MRRSVRRGRAITMSAVSSTGQPTCERLDCDGESESKKRPITSGLWGSMKKAVYAHGLHGKDRTEYAALYDILEDELQSWYEDQCEDLESKLEECKQQLQLEKAARETAESRAQQLESQLQEPSVILQNLQLLIKCLSAVVAESAAVSSTCKLMVKLYSAALSEAVGSDVIGKVEPLLFELIVQDPDLQSIKDALKQAGNGSLKQLWEATRSALTQLSQTDTVDASVRAVAELLASRKTDYPSTVFTRTQAAQAAFSAASNQSARDLDWLLDEDAHRVFDSGLTTLVNREQFKQVKQLLGPRSVKPSEFAELRQTARSAYHLSKDLEKLLDRVRTASQETQPSSSGLSPAAPSGGDRSKRSRS